MNQMNRDVEIDLRYTTPFSEMGLCEVVSDRDTLDTEEGYLLNRVVPRAHSFPTNESPRQTPNAPLGSSQIDPDGVAIIQAWIESIESCSRN